MIVPLRAILAILLAALYPTGAEPLTFLTAGREAFELPGARVSVAPAAAIAGLFLFIVFTMGETLLALHGRSGAILRRIRSLLPLLVHATLIFVFHWPLWIQEQWPGGGPPALAIPAALGPYAAMAGVEILALLREERGRSGRPAAALPTLLRLRLAFTAVAVGSILVVQGLTVGLDWVQELSLLHPSAALAAFLVMAALLLTCSSPLLRVLLGARPLGPGPLRRSLQALAARAGFGCDDFLVFGGPSGPFVNAMVVGPFARVRHVYLSRDLVDGLTASQVRCAAAHEISHVLLRHQTSFVALLGGLALLTAGAGELLESGGAPAGIVGPALLAAVAGALVGALVASRRFESEADLAGAALVGSAEACARTLERVAQLGRVDRRRPSWRHFSIDRRARILREAQVRPGFASSFLRIARRARLLMWALPAIGLPVFAAGVVQEARALPQRRELLRQIRVAGEGFEAVERGEVSRGLALLEQVDPDLGNGLVRAALARGADASGRPQEARAHRRRARELEPADPRTRVYLAGRD
jgi:Zn-dependent protease with chaperone function